MSSKVSVRRGVAALLTAVLAVAAGAASPVAASGASPQQVPGATPDQALIVGLLSTRNDCPITGRPPADQFGETVVGDGDISILTMEQDCGPIFLRATTIVSDAEPAAGFPYILHVTNIITVRRQATSFLPPLPCGVSITRHEVAWPDDRVPRSDYRNWELLTTFPTVSDVCRPGTRATVHLRVHAAIEGGSDHVPPQVRVGNRPL
jgi:hypothetical protein